MKEHVVSLSVLDRELIKRLLRIGEELINAIKSMKASNR
jgi:hypothetical protein